MFSTDIFVLQRTIFKIKIVGKSFDIHKELVTRNKIMYV